MAKVRDTAQVRVTQAVRARSRRRQPKAPPPLPTMPEPEVSMDDLKRLPDPMRRAVLESCKGDLYRLSWDTDGSILVN